MTRSQVTATTITHVTVGVSRRQRVARRAAAARESAVAIRIIHTRAAAPAGDGSVDNAGTRIKRRSILSGRAYATSARGTHVWA